MKASLYHLGSQQSQQSCHQSRPLGHRSKPLPLTIARALGLWPRVRASDIALAKQGRRQSQREGKIFRRQGWPAHMGTDPHLGLLRARRPACVLQQAMAVLRNGPGTTCDECCKLTEPRCHTICSFLIKRMPWSAAAACREIRIAASVFAAYTRSGRCERPQYEAHEAEWTGLTVHCLHTLVPVDCVRRGDSQCASAQ